MKLSHKVLLTTAFITGAALSAPAFAKDSGVNVDTLIEKNLQAHGGREALDKIQDMTMHGVMLMGPMEAPFTIYFKRPGKVRMEFEVQGMKGIQSYDGETGWAVMPFMGKTDPEKMAEDQLKDLKNMADFEGPLIDYAKKGHTVEYVGEADVEGTPAYELKLTKKDGDVDHIFLDKDYGLEVVTKSKLNRMGQVMEVETAFSNYKPVDGLVIAHAISSKINGQPGQKITINKVETNTGLSDDFFAMPKTKTENGSKDKNTHKDADKG